MFDKTLLTQVMDPRIGQLIRDGRAVHYAFVNGYSADPIEGTLEQVEIALGLRRPAARPGKLVRRVITLKPYLVHIEKKYPAWDEVGGFDWPIDARNGKEAVQKARKHAGDNWISGRMEGPIFYRARRVDEEIT